MGVVLQPVAINVGKGSAEAFSFLSGVRISLWSASLLAHIFSLSLDTLSETLIHTLGTHSTLYFMPQQAKAFVSYDT